jgi:hypothetical protein
MHRRNHRDRNFQDFREDLGNFQDLGNFHSLLHTSFRHIDRDSCLEDIYQLTVQAKEKVFSAADND